MSIGDQIFIFGEYFRLYFIENNGMALGMELGGDYGKFALSLFRVAAVGAIGWYLYKLTIDGSRPLLIWSISLIFAGAIGNIVDSLFYGVIFSESYYGQTAILLPEAGGYSGFFHGKVVDMLYVELINLGPEEIPSWIPDFFIGSDNHIVFFRPIFNLADASISVGVGIILIFQKKIFKPLS
jgi:signal peptidase II